MPGGRGAWEGGRTGGRQCQVGEWVVWRGPSLKKIMGWGLMNGETGRGRCRTSKGSAAYPARHSSARADVPPDLLGFPDLHAFVTSKLQEVVVPRDYRIRLPQNDGLEDEVVRRVLLDHP